MMFGNVAPAPLSFTWLAAGAASDRAAASATSGALVMRNSSVLERELRLEQALGAVRVLRCGGRPLVAQIIHVGEQAPVRCQLIGQAADEAGLLVGGVSRLRVPDVHARDDRDFGVGDLGDAER